MGMRAGKPVSVTRGVSRQIPCLVSALSLLLLLLHSHPCAAQKPGEDDRSDVVVIEEEQKKCVETPQEFAKAFAAKEPVCVSDNLIGRIFSGKDASNIYLQVNSKPASFYSGYDALERYLRSGYPDSFGYFTPSRGATLSQPNFPGLETPSNGFALLQTVGYDPQYIDIQNVYVLSVFDKRAIDDLVKSQNASAYPFNADVGPIQPTWDAVKEYYEWVYDDLDLRIPDEVIDVLKNTSFMTISGCPAMCTYTSLDFPSENMTTPEFTRERLEFATCPSSEKGTFQVTPSAADQNSKFCRGYMGREWKPKIAKMGSVFTSQYCEPSQSVTAAELLRDALQNTTDVIDQAQWFRAFLVQSCVGTFSSLFSGNGFTYTGDSGLLQPTATEYIASPFNVSALPPEGKVDIYFCINGLNGGRPDENGTCPIPVIQERGIQTSDMAPSVVPSAVGVPGGRMIRHARALLLGTLCFMYILIW